MSSIAGAGSGESAERRTLLHMEVLVGVAEGLESCGDGAYVTSFDEDDDYKVVLERVTDAVLKRVDAFLTAHPGRGTE